MEEVATRHVIVVCAPTLSRAVYDRLLFFMHFSALAEIRRSRPGPCGRHPRSGCGNKCRIHDDPDPYDIVEAVNDLTEAVEAVQKSIIWTRKARTCTGCGKRCGTAKRKHLKTYVLKCFSLVRVVIQNFSKTIVVQFVFKVIG